MTLFTCAQCAQRFWQREVLSDWPGEWSSKRICSTECLEKYVTRLTLMGASFYKLREMRGLGIVEVSHAPVQTPGESVSFYCPRVSYYEVFGDEDDCTTD